MTSRSSAVRRDPDRVNLAETLRFVRRNRWFLLGAVLVGASVAAATSQLRTQTYTAEAALLFDPRVVVSLPDSQDGGADIPLSQDLRSEVDMVLSHPVVTEAVGRVGLTQEALEGPSPAAGPLAPLREGLGLALGGDGRNAPSYETVREHVDAFNDGRSNTIRVEAQAPSPTLAADLANAVARSYIDQRRALTAEQMTAAKDFLGTHLADVRRQLEEAITSEQSFREQAGLLETGKGTIESQRLVDLIGQLAQVRANRARAEAKLPLLQSARGAENAAALAEVVSSINIANLTELEAQAKARESELATVFGPLHPSLQKARAELADLRGKINAEVRKIAQSVAQEVAVLKDQEASIQATIDQSRTRFAETESKRTSLGGLTSQTIALAKSYEDLLSRYHQIVAEADYHASPVQLLAPAYPPGEPSGLPTAILLLAGAVAGAMIGVLAALFRENADETIRLISPGDENQELPVIAMFPHLPGILRRLKSADFRPQEDAALEYIQTYLRLRLGDVGKVIAFTSSLPGEGKSTLSVAFAQKLRRDGFNVLLIDLDQKQPSVARYLGAPAALGVAATEGGADGWSVVRVHEPSGLHYVPVTGDEANLHSAEASRRFAEFLAQARCHYDYIVLDTPPLLSVSDAALACRVADLPIVVAKWGGTPREAVERTLRLLGEFGVDNPSVVLSQVNLSRLRQYGYAPYALTMRAA